MGSEHTPGPWMRDADGKIHGEGHMDGPVVALTDASPFDRSGGADADLIAAAPDLLTALIDAEKTLRVPTTGEEEIALLDRLRVAIAKAEGEQS